MCSKFVEFFFYDYMDRTISVLRKELAVNFERLEHDMYHLKHHSRNMGEDRIMSIIVLSLFILLSFPLDNYPHKIALTHLFVQEQGHLCDKEIMHWLNILYIRLYKAL